VIAVTGPSGGGESSEDPQEGESSTSLHLESSRLAALVPSRDEKVSSSREEL
jgi:hypothetical protein